MQAQNQNVNGLVVDAGTITALGTALAAVLTALARLIKVLRERRRTSCPMCELERQQSAVE